MIAVAATPASADADDPAAAHSSAHVGLDAQLHAQLDPRAASATAAPLRFRPPSASSSTSSCSSLAARMSPRRRPHYHHHLALDTSPRPTKSSSIDPVDAPPPAPHSGCGAIDGDDGGDDDDDDDVGTSRAVSNFVHALRRVDRHQAGALTRTLSSVSPQLASSFSTLLDTLDLSSGGSRLAGVDSKDIFHHSAQHQNNHNHIRQQPKRRQHSTPSPSMTKFDPAAFGLGDSSLLAGHALPEQPSPSASLSRSFASANGSDASFPAAAASTAAPAAAATTRHGNVQNSIGAGSEKAVRRPSRKLEAERILHDRELVALMDPASRNAWAAERFYILQQCPCKEYAVGLIREIDPDKQQHTPYRMKGAKVIERPPYWPADRAIRHTVTPSHLKKDERVNLLVHLLFLPDNDPAFYREWRDGGAASHNRRRHRSWAAMLQFVADGTTFRSDGPKLSHKAKSLQRGMNPDAHHQRPRDSSSPDAAGAAGLDTPPAQLDRSRFDVSPDERLRIDARLDVMRALISAAARVEEQFDGGFSEHRTRLPPLPKYFLDREMAQMMRRGRVKRVRKRKRPSSDNASPEQHAKGDAGRDRHDAVAVVTAAGQHDGDVSDVPTVADGDSTEEEDDDDDDDDDDGEGDDEANDNDNDNDGMQCDGDGGNGNNGSSLTESAGTTTSAQHRRATVVTDPSTHRHVPASATTSAPMTLFPPAQPLQPMHSVQPHVQFPSVPPPPAALPQSHGMLLSPADQHRQHQHHSSGAQFWSMHGPFEQQAMSMQTNQMPQQQQQQQQQQLGFDPGLQLHQQQQHPQQHQHQQQMPNQHQQQMHHQHQHPQATSALPPHLLPFDPNSPSLSQSGLSQPESSYMLHGSSPVYPTPTTYAPYTSAGHPPMAYSSDHADATTYVNTGGQEFDPRVFGMGVSSVFHSFDADMRHQPDSYH